MIYVIIINGPGVAGAVLQTPLSFVDSLIRSVILFLKIFKTLSIPNHKNWGEILRESWTPTICHMSCVTCHVSHVMCHVSGVKCHFFLSGGASLGRVCYQQGLPCLVFTWTIFEPNLFYCKKCVNYYKSEYATKKRKISTRLRMGGEWSK